MNFTENPNLTQVDGSGEVYLYGKIGGKMVGIYHLDEEFDIIAKTEFDYAEKLTGMRLYTHNDQVDVMMWNGQFEGEVIRFDAKLNELGRHPLSKAERKALNKAILAKDYDSVYVDPFPLSLNYFKFPLEYADNQLFRVLYPQSWLRDNWNRYNEHPKLQAFEKREDDGAKTVYQIKWECKLPAEKIYRPDILHTTDDAIYVSYKVKGDDDLFSLHLLKINRITGEVVFEKKQQTFNDSYHVFNGEIKYNSAFNRFTVVARLIKNENIEKSKKKYLIPGDAVLVGYLDLENGVLGEYYMHTFDAMDDKKNYEGQNFFVKEMLYDDKHYISLYFDFYKYFNGNAILKDQKIVEIIVDESLQIEVKERQSYDVYQESMEAFTGRKDNRFLTEFYIKNGKFYHLFSTTEQGRNFSIAAIELESMGVDKSYITSYPFSYVELNKMYTREMLIIQDWSQELYDRPIVLHSASGKKMLWLFYIFMDNRRTDLPKVYVETL